MFQESRAKYELVYSFKGYKSQELSMSYIYIHSKVTRVKSWLWAIYIYIHLKVTRVKSWLWAIYIYIHFKVTRVKSWLWAIIFISRLQESRADYELMNLPVSSDTQFSILLESLGKNKNYKENILIKKFHFINRHKLQKSNINLFCINVKVNKYIKQRILLNNASVRNMLFLQ